MEGLCSQTEARWFYAFYSKVYERLQPYFTSSEMREAGLRAPLPVTQLISDRSACDARACRPSGCRCATMRSIPPSSAAGALQTARQFFFVTPQDMFPFLKHRKEQGKPMPRITKMEDVR